MSPEITIDRSGQSKRYAKAGSTGGCSTSAAVTFTARAAITMGNASDEYLTRDPKDSAQQDRFGIEIQNGQKRLKELEATMSHFKFLKVALTSRFPDFKRQPIGLEGPTPRPPQAAASRDGETS